MDLEKQKGKKLVLDDNDDLDFRRISIMTLIHYAIFDITKSDRLVPMITEMNDGLKLKTILCLLNDIHTGLLKNPVVNPDLDDLKSSVLDAFERNDKLMSQVHESFFRENAEEDMEKLKSLKDLLINAHHDLWNF